MVQYFLRTLRPKFYGWLTKLIYRSRNVSFGSNLYCDSVPKILIDKTAKLSIGDNVQFRRNIEIRAHQNSKISIGNNVRIDRGVRLLSTNQAKISLNERVRVGLYTVFNGGDSITVGEGGLISGFVYLQTSMHGYTNKTISVQEQGYSHAPIELGNDTWLGTHVVILPGVVLSEGVVVGSNAVVNKSFEKFSVIAGMPARLIKERF